MMVFSSACFTPNDQHPGLIPLGSRILRDEVVGQLKIKVMEFHRYNLSV
jgi:hypothetical protein